MKLNVKKAPVHTHEGATAYHLNPELQLRRSVMACMLWEDQFYESGESISDRIQKTLPLVNPEKVSEIAIEAREQMKLRHIPLLLVRAMARLPAHKAFVAKTLERVIQRPDELTEFLAIYWKDGKEKLSAQVKKGLAAAFTKFDEYRLAKYNRDEAIKLRDVLFLSHAKPKDDMQAEVWKKLIAGTLAVPDTWEVSLSAGRDKKGTWERLIEENKLGALALLRNLRNMQTSGVEARVIINALESMKAERVLPFRFMSAARYAPNLEPYLEKAMYKCLEKQDKIPGKTAILIDHSFSMQQPVSSKSEVSRFDSAASLAILLRELGDEIRVFTFSDICVEVPLRRGFALRDAINACVKPAWTLLGAAVRHVYSHFDADRIIVITDEQSADQPPAPKYKGYVINVGGDQNGIGYGPWIHIDGWSEAVIDYIREFERG